MENERLNNDLDGKNFKQLKYDPSKNTGDILLGSSCDPDLHFCNINIKITNTPYIIPWNFHNFVDVSPCESLSAMHLNIRRMNKNFEILTNFLVGLKYNFSVIFFSETWFR